jgi:hypothetical protein
MNDQIKAKIREALKQLDLADDQHWTDDGLPRTNVVQKITADASISRAMIQQAWPGFQRAKPGEQPPAAPVDAAPGSGTGGVAETDPITGEQVESHADPAQNTGELMSEDEVRAVLDQHCKDAQTEVENAQQAVRDAHKRVEQAQLALRDAKQELTRQFPPLTAAQNIKQYIASEMQQRAAAHGMNALSGAQIDMVMQRSNSRGWRRPVRKGQTQTRSTCYHVTQNLTGRALK